MTTVNTFTIPYPPTVNRYWRVYNGQVVLSERAAAYKWDVKNEGCLQGAAWHTGNVSLTLEVYRPRAIGDLDNVFKAVCDALKGVAYDDDRQVVAIHAYRYDDRENPRVVVTVEDMP